jgi:serine protease Do
MIRLLLAAFLVLVPLLPAAAQTPASREQIRLTFAPVVRQAAPAVVNVYTRRMVRTVASPLFSDPFFRNFFGDVLPPGLSRQRVESSLGSGVIVAADGTVLTNHHVIRGADEITVVLADRREFEAHIVGSDERSDIAVLKVDPRGEKLPTLPYGDSDALEVGDLVIAIGNPFGVGQTVTSGIVSALARTNVGVSDYRSFIQTDAAINPGNSGGALVDMEGRLIGVNTAIFSKSGGSVGIGFAIPTALVKVVVAGLTQGGKVVRPYIGAGGQAVTQEIAQAMKLPRPMGVLIDQLAKDGPAMKAGLKLGDVVTAVNGREVDDAGAMRFRLATLAVGSEARLTVLRDGAQHTIDVRLVAPPETPPRDATDIGGNNPLAGATLANLNPALAEEIGINNAASGVIVMRVRQGSVAQRLQIQPGDIIAGINDRPVAAVADAKRLLSAESRGWRLTLNRDGQTLTLMIGG